MLAAWVSNNGKEKPISSKSDTYLQSSFAFSFPEDFTKVFIMNVLHMGILYLVSEQGAHFIVKVICQWTCHRIYLSENAPHNPYANNKKKCENILWNSAKELA